MKERDDNRVPMWFQELRAERRLRLAAQDYPEAARGLIRAADELKKRRRGRLQALAAATVSA